MARSKYIYVLRLLDSSCGFFTVRHEAFKAASQLIQKVGPYGIWIESFHDGRVNTREVKIWPAADILAETEPTTPSRSPALDAIPAFLDSSDYGWTSPVKGDKNA